MWGKYGCGVAYVMNAMTENAFKRLKTHIHFVDTATLRPRNDPHWSPLQKLKPLLDAVTENLEKLWSLGQTICIDECMVLCKGKFTSFVQCMASKPIKHGTKTFALCCSATGHLFNFEVHLGKEFTEDGSPAGVVERLLSGANMAGQGEGRTLHTDNWHTTASVMKKVWLQCKMSMLGTFTPTKKVSRTADDFPFAKLSNGALKRVPRVAAQL